MKLIPKPFVKAAVALTFGALASGLGAQSVSAATIACPLSQIRREITTPLPTGWWNTPIVSNLQSTRVIAVGGRKALQCRYGGAGAIQRYAPAGQTCTATASGFTCTGATPRPQTFSTGGISLRQTYLADFDRNSAASSAADLWFEAETSTLLYLVPRNGAQFALGNRSNRGYAGCAAARYSAGRLSLSDVPVGAYVCVKTSEGRISQFRMNAISAGSPKTLQLGYTTWR